MLVRGCCRVCPVAAVSLVSTLAGAQSPDVRQPSHLLASSMIAVGALFDPSSGLDVETLHLEDHTDTTSAGGPDVDSLSAAALLTKEFGDSSRILLGMQDGAGAASQPVSDQTVPTDTGRRLRTWEMPAVQVVGEQPEFREDELIGSYGQPRWTATRRFPTTRVYVIPEGKVEVEFWARGTFNKDSEEDWRFLQEIEVGLPHRFQVDLYLRQDYSTEDSDLLWGGQFEVRWALADWGKIWGNPTLYFEYITLEDRPDKIEPKILFGGNLAPRWHWALNLVGEFELGGEQEYEYQVTSGVSYSVVDSKFAVGVENILTFADTKDNRGTFETKYVIGPSFQWRPVPPMTVNVAPLFGIGEDSPRAQLWVNIGWEF